MMDAGHQMGGRRLTRLRTLGRGASGAVVSLFAAGEELFAVKSAASAAGAEQLRCEGAIMASLCSPHVLPCHGFRATAGGEYQLLLEFAPGGSLADEVERNGGRLEEPAVRAFAADVARGIAYLHGESVVHGDVKATNVVVGADGRAKLADFGCARRIGSSKGPIGGTPAFMAPEVARGEEQGPAADIWALGCTVIEMATGRAPWTDMDEVVAAVRLIGYTDALPKVPEWLSAEAKDFLDKCLRRDASKRWTAAQLLEHPFLASTGCGVKAEDLIVKAKWVSPKSTLDAALWESDADDEDDELVASPADRIRSLAGPFSTLPVWESDDGWIEVCGTHSKFPSPAAVSQEEILRFLMRCDISVAAVVTSSEQTHCEVIDLPVLPTASETTRSGNFRWDEPEAEVEAEPSGADLDAGDDPVHNVGAAGAYGHRQQQDILQNFTVDPVVVADSNPDEEIVNASFPSPFASPVTLSPLLFVF